MQRAAPFPQEFKEIDVKSPRAVCVGEGLVVLVAEPGPLENSQTFQRSSGGAEANVARVFAQLGLDASWISRVGDDGFGRYLLGALGQAGVDTSAVVIDSDRPTGIYVKQRGSGTGQSYDLPLGDSSMAYYRTGSAASAMSTDDLVGRAAQSVKSADIVHFSGITVALSESCGLLTESLLDASTPVSFDLNYRPALWRHRTGDAAQILAQHVRRSDVVLMGADEAGVVFGVTDPDELRRIFPEPRHLVIKNDAHAVTAFEDGERVDVPALRLNVVEKIGAGDAFAGGFLTGLLTGRTSLERIRLGHLCAAGALTGHGDVAALLPSDRLDELSGVTENEWLRLSYPDAGLR